jgi:peroxiredoxin Q/BCP
MSLNVGDPAPTVRARNQHDELIELDFADPTVLYFYPRDGTPGCTTEACQFEAERETYQSDGVAIYGVSTDDVDSHADFATEHDIGFDLLVDPDADIADSFDVDTSEGRATRTTFVLDDGEVRAVYEDVDPDGHARELGMDLYEAGLLDL